MANRKYEVLKALNSLIKAAYDDGFEEGKKHAEVEAVKRYVKPKTANQQRAGVIRQAREFWDENADDDFHYEIDTDKRAVFVWKLISDKEGYNAITGLAVCPFDYVFNADIEKAIALARALETDIPREFLEAVQPDRYAIGQIAQRHDEPIDTKLKYRINSIGEGLTLDMLRENRQAFCDTTVPLNYETEDRKALKVIDDTNAKYEEANY